MADAVALDLGKGSVAVLDRDVWVKIKEHKWHAQTGHRGHVYAATNLKIDHRKYRYVKMHRMILNEPEGLDVDHINGDTLDNRLCNLRICSHAENTKNQRAKGSIEYKGVSFHKVVGRYSTNIRSDGKSRHLGYFDNPIDAAMAYDAEAVRLYGPFARTNFGAASVPLIDRSTLPRVSWCKICRICGTEFPAKSSIANLCSRRCDNKLRWQEHLARRSQVAQPIG